MIEAIVLSFVWYSPPDRISLVIREIDTHGVDVLNFAKSTHTHIVWLSQAGAYIEQIHVRVSENLFETNRSDAHHVTVCVCAAVSKILCCIEHR